MSTIQHTKKKKQTVHQFLQITIERLVKPPISWAQQMKIMKKLWSENPNKKIWASIDIKLNSLAFFIMPEGKQYLQKIIQSINFEIVKKEMPKLGSEIYGEEIKISKPLSIKDFLKQK